MKSLGKFEVVNLEQHPKIAKHVLFANHPGYVIPVIASMFVHLPFTNTHDAGHLSHGSIAD